MLNLFNMDCMEMMARYDDKHFDLAIVDPPYFSGPEKEKYYGGAAVSDTGVMRTAYSNLSEEWEVPDQKYFDELFRVSKEQIIWGCNYYAKFIPAVGRIVWDKVNDSSSYSKAELASCSLHNSTQMFRFMWNGMLQGNMKDKEIRIHQCQKPVALYKWLLHNYAGPGDKILDTHLGSGSIAVACHYSGNDLTASELNKEYYDLAMKRIKEETKQIKLF